MSVENPFKVNLEIAETIKVIGEIAAQQQKRSDEHKESLIVNLKDDLEIVSQIINSLDNAFIILVQHYSNKTVIEDPLKLQLLVQETDNYLKKRELLPKLENQIGAINAAANHKLLKNTKAQEILRHLLGYLKDYRDRLGFGMSGVGHSNLEQLLHHAKYQFDPELIVNLANRAFINQDFSLSGRINNLAGSLKYEITSIK